MDNIEHEANGYRREYARCAPIFLQMWQQRPVEMCRWALQDIYNTLVGREMDAYTGRLYAELDAVRDRMMALKREGV
jgi:hypothetical protein